MKKIVSILLVFFFVSFSCEKEIKYYFRKAIEGGKITVFPIDKCETCFLIANSPINQQQLLKIVTPIVYSSPYIQHIKNTEYIFYFYKENKNLTRDFKHIEYDEWGWNWNYDEIWHHDKNKVAEVHLLLKNEKEERFNYYSQNPEGYNFYKYGIPKLNIKQSIWMINGKYFDTNGKEIFVQHLVR
jgi:hypothetical protein